MRVGTAGVLAKPALLRKVAGVLVVGSASLAILVATVILGAPMTAVTVGAVLMVAAAATVLYPEVGLFALLINALVGLTHAVDLPRLGPVSVPIAFEGVLALAFAIQVAMARRRTFLNAPQHYLVFALSFWVVISLLVSGHVTEENVEALRSLFVVRVMVFLLVTNILAGLASLRRLLAVFALSNVGLILVSIATRVGLFGQEKVVVSEKMLRTSALVHNPNSLAFELTTMLIVAVFTFLYVKRRWLRALLMLLAVGNGLMILSTLSRSGFISLVAVLVFMFFKLTRSARVIALVLMLCILLGLVSGSNLARRFKRIDEIRDVDRYSTAVVGLNTAYHNPLFGVGLGNFLHTFDRYDTVDVAHPMPTHNMYLDLASQMGFPALGLYLGILGVTWIRMRRLETDLRRRGSSASFQHLFSLGVQCFLVNLCVFGLSGDVEFEYSVFTMIGFSMVLYRLHQEDPERGSPAPAGPAPGAGGGRGTLPWPRGAGSP